MSAFILTWSDGSEKASSYEELREAAETCRRQGYVDLLWRIYAKNQAQKGDRAFLLKQRREPRGIFGIGELLEAPRDQKASSDPEGAPKPLALVRFTTLLDPRHPPLLISAAQLERPPVGLQVGVPRSGHAALEPHVEKELLILLGIVDTPSIAPPDIASGVGGLPTTGPVPSPWIAAVERTVAEIAYTYAFRFGHRAIWKIGHAEDVKSRLVEVNKHVPHEVLGEQWRIAYCQRWPTSLHAYDMEQAVLQCLNEQRTTGERVLCSEREIESAWSKAMASLPRVAHGSAA